MVTMLGLMLFIAPNYAWADHQDDASVDQSLAADALTIRGKVKTISLEEHTIVVKPRKGKQISVVYTEQTPLVGFESMEEIKRKQPLKIWYTVEGDINLAIKIEKIPETGC